MRTPNYKVGWLVSEKLAALTHFHPEITQEDIAGVFTETQHLIQEIKQPFHIIIDNRLAPLSKLYSLEELQKASPLLCHPFLNYLVLIKPNHLELTQNETMVQTRNQVHLKNVSTVAEAIDFVKHTIPDFNGIKIDSHFFA